MRKRAGKKGEIGREEGCIEVYIEIEYNRYSFKKLLNKFTIRVLENLKKITKFKNI